MLIWNGAPVLRSAGSYATSFGTQWLKYRRAQRDSFILSRTGLQPATRLGRGVSRSWVRGSRALARCGRVCGSWRVRTSRKRALRLRASQGFRPHGEGVRKRAQRLPDPSASGSVGAAVAAGLALRYEGGRCFRSEHYQVEIDHLGPCAVNPPRAGLRTPRPSALSRPSPSCSCQSLPRTPAQRDARPTMMFCAQRGALPVRTARPDALRRRG